MIDLKADQDEIKEVLGNEYQDYNLERYQQTDIQRIEKRLKALFVTKLFKHIKK